MEKDNGDCFYGMPEVDYLGLKVCEHTGGVAIKSPSEIDTGINKNALERTEQFMQEHLVHGRRRLVHHSTCMYTMSPDGHFYVDHYPGHSNVVLAAGMSGHGFKFAPVIGKQLIDLLEGQTDPDFEFLKIGSRA